MRDLTATAGGNASERRAAAERLLGDDSTGMLARFRQFASQSSFSTTVTADKVLTYNEVGELLDTRRTHIHRAAGDEASGLAAFAAAQRTWLARREAFEDLWRHGRNLLYGAVNAGGMGAGGFGSFCLLTADPESPPADALAVFPGDSLQRYTTAVGDVDEDRCVEEATAWTDRADLALVQRADEASRRPEQEWPQVVCGDDGYLEVARAGTAPVDSVSEARMRAADRARLDDLRARVLIGEALSSVEENEVAAYDVLHGWRRSHGTAITEVT